MISIEGLSVEFGANPLFDDITYVINKKDRIALVGKNGAGKIYHVENYRRIATANIGDGEYS